jgi:hypothetical protein
MINFVGIEQNSTSVQNTPLGRFPEKLEGLESSGTHKFFVYAYLGKNVSLKKDIL